MQIESAGVTKNGALVDSEGRLSIFASQEGEDRHINQTSGKVWSVPFVITTTGANAYVFHMKNTGTKNLHVTDIRMVNTGTASAVDIDAVTGIAAGTTDVIPVSRNIGNPVIMAADNHVASAGTGITGLTDAGLLFPKYSKANDEIHLKTSSNIILPPGQAIAIKVVTSGAILTGSVSVAEVNVETGAR